MKFTEFSAWIAFHFSICCFALHKHTLHGKHTFYANLDRKEEKKNNIEIVDFYLLLNFAASPFLYPLAITSRWTTTISQLRPKNWIKCMPRKINIFFLHRIIQTPILIANLCNWVIMRWTTEQRCKLYEEIFSHSM